MRGKLIVIGKLALVLLLLFMFFTSVKLLGKSFKLFGGDFSHWLINLTENPFIGLFIGILATSIIQSSSMTTSIVVAMLGTGAITVPNAIPIVMGANIGTTITCSLVSVGNITRKLEFQRSLSSAFVHDFFNVIVVLILFPLEITTHFLERLATWSAEITSRFSSAEGMAKVESPLNAIINPIVHFIESIPKSLGMSDIFAGIVMLVIAVGLLFVSLYFFTKILRSVMQQKIENLFDKVLFRNPWVTMIIGALITSIIQSSSITTSLMVPLVGAGILKLEQAFPFVLGANVGTTITAMLASLTAGEKVENMLAARTVAFVHLYFNLLGILIVYPIKFIRQIPIALARSLSKLAAEKKVYFVIFIITIFFVVPGLFILLYHLLGAK